MYAKQIWNIARSILLMALIISPIGSTGEALAAPARNQPASAAGPQVNYSPVSISQPLGSISLVPVTSAANPDIPSVVRNRLSSPKAQTGSDSGSADFNAVQTIQGGGGLPSTPLASFDGVGANGSLPPDTNGAIGYDATTKTKYYMQWVNTALQIWDVTNTSAVTSLYGPTNGNTALFTGMGGLCETTNAGDPIVLFDHLANRWFASQFAYAANNYRQCIAVSQTANPLGSWYRYDFQISTTKFNDYPKFGVWNDGYYMSINQFNFFTDAWLGAGAVVFERDKMLAGQGARMIYFDVGAVNLNYGNMLPSDVDGPAPSSGAPNYFMEWDNSTWIPGDTVDSLRIWNFHVDWTTPANSTFGLAGFAPNTQIATSNVDPSLGNIAQPGTAQKLDSIPDRLMFRLQYRNFGTYQTLVSNHSVDSNGLDKAGIHWFELRNSGLGWGMQQQGVYAPDTDSRWMGSVAMDATGNIALGYSVSSSTTYPSVRYTARAAADAPGQMTLGEISMVVGAGVQTSTTARWGDYSSMSVDPLNDCTFWYTQEYYSTTSNSGWKTRIGAFRVPSCSPFADVPIGAFAQNYIEALYNAGVTSGCGSPPRRYCPGNQVTRAEMAVFLLKAMGTVPPPATGTVFTDVPISYWAASYIEKLSSLGITSGCAAGKFCPDSPVARDQMAVFLLKAKGIVPPAATGTVFTDVPITYWDAAYIERLSSLGITSGCGVGLYCPGSLVTRDQMAVFLVKTFGLPLP